MDKLKEYHRECLKVWGDKVGEVVSPGKNYQCWNDLAEISKMIGSFTKPVANHAHLPTGGGQDIESVRLSQEPDCLDLEVTDGLIYRVRPSKLEIEVIEGSKGNSFLLLHLSKLDPVLLDGEDDEYVTQNYGSQELLEVNGEFFDRSIMDRGYFGFDEYGDEIPIPENAKILVRWFGGKILIVSKGSLWNGTAQTYGGEHNSMNGKEIRSLIEGSLEN